MTAINEYPAHDKQASKQRSYKRIPAKYGSNEGSLWLMISLPYLMLCDSRLYLVCEIETVGLIL